MSLGLVTVFGGAGFIGRYLVKRLAAQGARVRVALRRPEEAMFLKPMGAVGQIEIVAANFRHGPSLTRAVQGADAVVTSVGVLYSRGTQSFETIHARAPGYIAKVAAESGVKKLLHVSAIGADENSPSAYARSKGAGERLVREAFPAATIVRPSIVFGPEDGFFNRFANLARFAPVLPLIGGGQNKMQPVYVGDVAAAMQAALNRADAAGRTYELGGPRVYTFEELMQLTCDIACRKRFLVPVPAPVASALATLTQWVPVIPPLLTSDQVKLLQIDNVVAPGAAGLADLGVSPTPAEGIIETYLARYRRGGQKGAPRFG
jgi:NADH dehydrogenase